MSMLSNKSNATKGLSVTLDKYSITTWIDRHVYNSLKIVDTVLPYLFPPSCSVLYNLGVSNRVCLETLHLETSFEFKRKFIQARLINDEIFVIQEFFSEKDHNVFVFSAWLERNPHIICTWQLDFKGDIINVSNDLFDDTNFKLPTIAEIQNPNKQPSCVLTPLQSIQMNVSEHRQYILDTLRDTLETYGKIELISDEDYDDSRSILAYREEFYSVQMHFDILLASLTLTTMNLHKDLLIELKSLWEAAIHIVSKFEVDQALSILEWLPAMWMQVIGCPDVVRTRDELFYILYEILSDPDLDWTQEAVVKSLIDRKFRYKFAQWIGRHIFNHSEYIERDLWDISEPIDWNSYLFIENNIVKYRHAHSKNGNFNVTSTTENQAIKLKVINGAELFDVQPFDVSRGSKQMSMKNYAENVFNHMQEILKVNENCYFLGHCTTEESIIKMSKYGMSPYAGFGNKKSCGHGMYFFKMSKTDKTFEDLNKKPSNITNYTNFNGNSNDDIIKEFQGFLYAISERVNTIDVLAVMLFLIKEDEEKLKAIDTTKVPFDLRSCNCDTVFKEITKDDVHVEYARENLKGLYPTTKDTINALSLIKNDDVERFNIFALISGVVDFNEIPNGIFRGNIFDGSCNITKSSSFPPKAMPAWVKNEKQFGLWKNACSSLPIENYRRKYGFFDDGIFKICKQYTFNEDTFDLPTEMWEHVFVSSAALQNLLEFSLEIHILFLDSDALSSSIVPCDNSAKFNDYIMNKNWLKGNLSKGMPRHSYWTLCLQCLSNGLDFEKCSNTIAERDDNYGHRSN